MILARADYLGNAIVGQLTVAFAHVEQKTDANTAAKHHRLNAGGSAFGIRRMRGEPKTRDMCPRYAHNTPTGC